MGLITIDRLIRISFLFLVISLCWPIKFTTISMSLFLILSICKYKLKPLLVYKKEPLVLAVTTYFFLIIVYFLFEEDKQFGVKFIERSTTILATPFIYHHVNQKKINEFRIDIILFVFSVFVAVGWSTYNSLYHFNFFDLYSLSVSLTEYTIIDSNYFAIFISLSIIILLEYLIKSKTSILTTSLLIVIMLSFIVYLVLLAARVALFTTFLLITIRVLYVFYDRRRFIYMISAAIIFTLAFLSSIMLSPYLKQRIVTFYTHGFEADFRYYEFKAAINAIQANPIFGYGIKRPDEVLMDEYKKMGFVEGIKYGFNAHNQSLQSTLHFGVWGFFVLILIYFFLIKSTYQTRNFLFLSFSILFIFFSLTEAVLERNKGTLFLSFFIGFFLPQKTEDL